MTTPFDEFIHKLESVEYLDSDRVAVYESLFRQNFHINTEKGGPVCFSSKETKHRALNIICSDLKSENVKFVVGSLMMLSCLLSDSKGDAIDHNTLECAFDCVIHHLKGSHYDCTLLCLYTIACNSIVTLRKECTVEVYSLCSEIIISSNRRDTLIKNKDQETTHEVQTKRSNKLKCWAYRAMINTRQTSEVLTLHPLGSDLICETFQSIVVALRKRPTVLDFVGTAYTNGDTADAALLLAQLQMLVGIPVGGGLACVLENAFPACKEFSNIIR